MLTVRDGLAIGAIVAALALAESAPAPVGVVCSLTGGGGCQLPDQAGHGAGGSIASVSDANPNFGALAADNFSPAAGGQVTSVCWWGVYTNFVADCGGSPPADSFTITFYTNKPAVPGPIPSGVVAGGPFSVTPVRAATGNVVPSGIGNLVEFEYTATLPNPVNVQVNRCYWIQIRNSTTGACAWLWSAAGPGDGRSAQHDDGTYDAPDDSDDFDLAWCLNVAIATTGACIPAECGAPGAGPCDAPHPAGGCIDQACCAAVCAVDATCCSQDWDEACVALAYGPTGVCTPAGCGTPATGGCFDNDGSPYCDDTCDGDACPGCCNTVCAVDPFCCDKTWDVFCVGEAEDLCVGCKTGPPPNNSCATAAPIGIGTFPLTNECAAAGAPDHRTCDDGFTNGLGPDVWFLHTATFTGSLLILPEAAPGSGWNTQCAVYQDNNCGALEDPPLACAPIGGGTVISVTFNTSYLIRVGGTFNGPTGTGTITLLGVFPACGGPGDCLTPHVGAGCGDINCCAVVCAADPTCCSGPWDLECSLLAMASCEPLPCGPMFLGDATLIEPEACGADNNGGCDTTPPPAEFTVIGDDAVIAGSAWADGGARDTDWYRLPFAVLSAADSDADGLVDIHAAVQSELPVSASVIVDTGGNCDGDEVGLGTVSHGQNCTNITPGVATVTLDPANRYAVVAATGDVAGAPILDGFPCGGGSGYGSDYLLCVSVTNDGAVTPSTVCLPLAECAWDCQGNPDGNVGINDLLDLLSQWNTGGACNFDGGLVGITDLLKLLANWGPCG